ncbi:MAG: hypothetical protein LBL72_06890 [Candidatus Accumulibacter sp.]|jgi:hypothetical protein|nr:hypothetical protein [Accumulibacter sp.]
MGTLTQARNTLARDGVDFTYPVAASTRIYAGGIVTLSTTGFARGGAAGGTKAVGIAAETADNSSGAAGAALVKVKRGVFGFNNSASADLIKLGDVGAPCYVVDDETVAKTDDDEARVVAGVVADVETLGSRTVVWVDFR